MSLIDEALRNTQSQATKQAQVQTPVAKPKQETKTAHSWSGSADDTLPELSRPAASSLLTTGILAVIAIAGLYAIYWLWQNGSTQNIVIESTAVQTTPVATPPPVPVTIVEPVAVTTNVAASREFNLSGIVLGSGTPYAMINGEILSVGDTIGKATVTSIGKNFVVLNHSKYGDTRLDLHVE